MGKASSSQDIQELYHLLSGISDPEVMKNLLEDLCTSKEIANISKRIRAAKLLMEGKTYAQVIEQTEISSATLSRVSRCVQCGKGYSELLK